MAAIMNPQLAREAHGQGASVDLQVQVRRRVRNEAGAFELDVNFRAPQGITIVFGPSGAGKTMLLDCIAGISEIEAGRVAIGNRVLYDSGTGTSEPMTGRAIGYVFQDLALFPNMSAEANVAYGLGHLDSAARRRRVAESLELFGIPHLAKRRPAELSGGERQRVALARALVTGPEILLLDEPLSALDLPVRMKIADDLRRSIATRPIPVLYVTHNRDEVFMLGERMLVLERGRIIAEGTPHEVMAAPRSETVAQLAGFENVFDAQVTATHEQRGTMTCMVCGVIELETPLVRAEVGSKLRVGISAGDILLAASAPAGLSARNILAGRVISLEQRDMIVVARVDCGVQMAAHLTLAARDAMELSPGRKVWLIVKTHSCHLLSER